jgi:transaldolase
MSAPKMPLMTGLGADWWNDSGSPVELAEAVNLGATGATSNPVIVSQTIKAAPEFYAPVIDRLIEANPAESEDEIAWRLIAALAREGAKVLSPVFVSSRGAKGYLSVQVNPKYYCNPRRMVAQGGELSGIAANIAIKVPATEAGIAAIEEMIANGISVNATVSFSVPQAIAVAEAFERGFKRARVAGANTAKTRAYITIMIGRVDDHLRRVSEQQKIQVDAGALDWAGIAVFKNTHRIFKSRGYQGTLLAAAYRHQGHWSEIIGAGVLQTIPYTWWKKFNASDHIPEATLDRPVDDRILNELRSKFPDFTRAHDEKGMLPSEFVRYGATRNTLDQFLNGYAELVAQIRPRMLLGEKTSN